MAYERSEKEQKYDRQMRLWGSEGQSRLEKATVLVLGSDAVAAETLKNMVLPGIGQFTIVDDAFVTNDDLANNFFVDQDNFGCSRAMTVYKLLIQLNPDVQGKAIHRSVDETIRNNTEFVCSFSLVILTKIDHGMRRQLADMLYNRNIPLILVQSLGMIGSVRLQVKEHYVLQTHQEKYDLFIHPEQAQFFMTLHSFLAQFNPESEKDGEAHAHIPFIAILTHFMSKWKREHGGQIPKTYDEKQQFKALIRSATTGDELNFEEALDPTNIAHIYNIHEFPWIVDLFNDPALNSITEQSPRFWILVKAIKQFVDEAGHLPVIEHIPDMHCLTKDYVALKKIYHDKAVEDLKSVSKLLDLITDNLRAPPFDEVEVASFVRNFRQCRIVRTRSLANEDQNPCSSMMNNALEEALNEQADLEQMTDDESPLKPHNVHWYLALVATSIFATQHKRLPGKEIGSINTDISELQYIVQHRIAESNLQCELIPETLEEIVRYAGKEFHNTSAFLGGVASQVALQIIIQQFTPLNHTFVFNGIDCISDTFEL